MPNPMLATSCLATLLALAVTRPDAEAQVRRVDTRARQPSTEQRAYVTSATGSRAAPTTSRERVDLLQRMLENRQLDETALASPVRLTPSRPNQVNRLYANLRSATTIAGPAGDEAWVLTPAADLSPVSGGWNNLRLFSAGTPMAQLFGSPRLTLTIRRGALKSKALVECGITAAGDGLLSLGGTVAAQTVALKNGAQHLDVVVQIPTSSSDDGELFLEPKSLIAVNYCEVTALK